jgi:hypothetical protein
VLGLVTKMCSTNTPSRLVLAALVTSLRANLRSRTLPTQRPNVTDGQARAGMVEVTT